MPSCWLPVVNTRPFIACSFRMNRFSRGGIERSLTALWYGNSSLALLLQPFAFLYRAGVAVRVGGYRSGLFREERIRVPVIVVGNLTAGGTGKTPVVSWLAGKLSEIGLKPGIVSRGYAGRRGQEPVMVTDASGAAEVGDEALMLARRSCVPVCVAVDRVAAARRLLAEKGVDVIVADDGLQHYRLARDLEIAVVDGQRGLGNRHLLPAGPLREPVERLSKVDYVLVNGGSDAVCGDDLAGFRFTLHATDAVTLDQSERRELDSFSGTRVWSVAGIGNPQRFTGMLKSRGIDPVAVDVPDHGTVSLSGLREKQPWPILMTEKDAVKYSDDTIADAWYVPVDVQMPAELESSIMKRIQSLVDDV
jgi:tetraacyldisaccharide 4'-kinase